MTYEFKTESTYQQYFTKAHDMVRKSVREFIKKEVLPFYQRLGGSRGISR
ncbi:MAG: hypothetical protein R2875_15195 [Desulfobacterales bacterium]